MIQKILAVLRISNEPALKLYRGFGSPDRVVVQGHAFRRSPLPRSRYRRNFLINTLALLRLFLIKPSANAPVRVRFAGQQAEMETDTDGFFRLELPLDPPLPPGWHPVEADLLSTAPGSEAVLATGQSEVLVPFPTRYAFVSDIDDTFLISHSATILKRIRVLLTENAHSRDPFEGVVEHYNQLASTGTTDALPNAFFYVSSSEWNLYDYIREFSEKNNLPKGVYLLSQLKRFRQLLQTGQNKHATKFDRIVRILEACPSQQFVLLGDDAQEDPTIYASVAAHFPGRIYAVYLRRVNPKKAEKARTRVAELARAGVLVCHFTHSAEARQHSQKIGLGAKVME